MATKSILDQFILQALIDKLNELAQAFIDAVVRVVNEDNDQFSDDIKRFQNNLVQIITQNQIGESLNELFTSYEKVGANAFDNFKLGLELFDFGSLDTPIPFSDIQNSNNEVVNLGVKTNALSMALSNASQIQYGNENELNTVISQLEDQYNDVISLNLDDDSRNALTDLRSATMQFLFDLQLSSVIQIKTPLISASVLSYQYYEDSTRSQEIISLNNVITTGFIKGNVQIVSE